MQHGCCSEYDVGPSRILAHMLKTFRAAVSGYANSHLRTEHAELFASVTSRRLHGFGFCSIVPAIKGIPEWPMERSLACTRHIIALRKDLRPQQASEWTPGSTRLLAVPLDTKLPVPWSIMVQGRGPVQHTQRPTPDRGIFAFACPANCGTIHVSPEKPIADVAGSQVRWPKWWCDRCRRHLRVGLAKCQRCFLGLRTCRCSVASHSQGPAYQDLAVLFHAQQGH